jgi:phosphopantetheinyl transferase
VQLDDIHILDNVLLRLASSVVMSTEELTAACLPGYEVTKREGGKPDLGAPDGRILPCSITHTSNFSAICWGDTGHIGIDAERSDRVVHAGLPARMCHPEDDIRLMEQPIEAWIIKESVLKCIGTGLRLAMNKISVQFSSSDRFTAKWNGHLFHGILLTRHDIRLCIVHTSSSL